MTRKPTMETAHENDQPITKPEQDFLDRRRVCAILAQLCIEEEASEGRTIGLVGRWGSGKTSCLNLTEHELEKTPDAVVVKFNPWMWSDSKSLVSELLKAIADQCECGDPGGGRAVASKLIQYGNALSLRKAAGAMPTLLQLAGWEELAQVAAMTLDVVDVGREFVGQTEDGRRQLQEETPERLLESLKEALRNQSKQFVVLIDDIDRLEPEELQQMLKAVRLTARLPKVTYLIALDKATVAKVLDRRGFEGEDYLEKIIEIEVPVPMLQTAQRLAFLRGEMLKTTNKHGRTPVMDEQETNEIDDVIRLILTPLLQTPRDLKRCLMRVDKAFRTIPPRVKTRDVIALEAVRSKLPKVGGVIDRRAADITVSEWTASPFAAGGDKEDVAAKEAGDELEEAAGQHKNVVKELIRRCFPRVWAARGSVNTSGESWGHSPWSRIQAWREEGRIGEQSVLETVLGRKSTREFDVAGWTAQVMEKRDSGEALERFLHSLRPEDVQDVVGGLEIHADQFEGRHGEEMIPVLMDLRRKVPDGPTRISQVDEEGAFLRVVARLVNATSQGGGRLGLNDITRRIQSIGAQARFLDIAGWEHKQARPAWEEEVWEKAAEAWLERLEQTPEAELEKDPDLFYAADLASRTAARTGQVWTIWDNTATTRKILEGSASESVNTHVERDIGEMVHKAEKRAYLLWESLKRIWGSEGQLMKAVEKAQNALPWPAEVEDICLELAWEYHAGRTDEPFEREEEVTIGFGTPLKKALDTLLQEGESMEDLCAKALRRGHGVPWWMGVALDLAPGKPAFPHPVGVKVRIYEAQKQAAERHAETMGVSLEEAWGTILAAGVDHLMRERTQRSEGMEDNA